MAGNIGSVGVEVVPDSRNFWRRFEAETRGGDHDVRVRVNADTAQARAQIDAVGKSSNNSARQTHLLRDAIIALGPAAVPVTAVAAGAFAGLIPTVAALALGIKGISKELKDGSLPSAQFANDISRLKGEVNQLEQISAKGVLTGLDSALRGSGPLFRTLNQDMAELSGQFGVIAGNTAPALLSLLTQLNPLFNTLGLYLEKGSAGLKRMAESGHGVSGFVSYVQAELPTVISTFGSLVQTAAHLVQSLAPLGHSTLIGLRALSQVINDIPVPVLTALEQGGLAVYAAFRTYQGITTLVNNVTGALLAFQSRQAASAAVAQAAATAQQAAAAESAAGVAESQAAEAAAVAAAQRDIAASLAGTGSILEEEAVVAAQAATEFAAAQEAEAAAARAAATQIAASAAAQAEAVDASGAATSLGFGAALGPIGALVAGVGILGFSLLNSGHDAQQAQQAMDSYSESVKKSSNALSQVNKQQTADNLAKAGAFQLLDQLHAGNQALTVSYTDLINAVSKGGSALQDVQDRLGGLIKGTSGVAQASGIVNRAFGQLGFSASGKVAGQIGTLSKGLHDAIVQQTELTTASRQLVINQLHGASAATQHARALGLSTQAFLDAKVAEESNTTKLRDQTAAMRVAGDAAGLLAAAFDRLNGKTLDVSDAEISYHQALLTTVQGLKGHAQAWSLDTQAGQQNRSNVNQAIRQAQALAQAISGGTKLTQAGTRAYRESLVTLRNRLVADHASKQAIDEVNRSLAAVPGLIRQVGKTPADVNTDHARARVKQLQGEINAIKQGKQPGLSADNAAGRRAIKTMQYQIDAIRQHTIPAINVHADNALTQLAKVYAAENALHNVDITATTYVKRIVQPYVDAGARTGSSTSADHGGSNRASGGFITGPGSGTSDSIPAWLSNGEYVINARQTAKHRALLDNINKGVQGFAQGGAVGITSGKVAGKPVYYYNGIGYASLLAAENARTRAQRKTGPSNYTIDGSATQYGSLRSAENAAHREITQRVKLAVSVEQSGFRDWAKALAGTVRDAKAAFAKIERSAEQGGVPGAFFQRLQAGERRLLAYIADRNTTTVKLGREQDRLKAIVANFNNEFNTVRSGITGSFDITSAGADANGRVTGGGVLAAVRQDENRVKKFVADAKRLRGKINDGYWAQLVGKGPDALPQVDALLSLPASLRRSIDASARDIGSLGSSLGTTAADELFGAQRRTATREVAQLKDRLHRDNTVINRTLERMEKAISGKLDHYADRPVNVYMNGKIVGKILAEEQKKAHR